MEFLTGTDLGSMVAQRGPMSSLQAARAIADSAQGLQAAYLAGLIHRDVKPANLVMLDNGQVKVTDFGLAKPVDPKNEPALTAMGVVVGTPDYIAPEQARGEAIDEKVDIYALGGTLYYLLVGSPPFRKGNPSDDKYLKVVARHLRDPAPNPMLVVPEVDPALARLQLRLMAKKPEARPSYTELLGELTSIIERLGGSATLPPHTSSQQADAAPQTREPRPGPSAKTPFLGGNRQSTDVTRLADDAAARSAANADADADGAETSVRLPTHQSAPGQNPGGQAQAGPTPSRYLSPSHQQSAQQSQVAKPERSKVLVAITALSALVFVVGLGLFLAGPMPDASSAPALVVPDAAPIAVATTPDAAPAPLQVPDEMLLLPANGEHPAAFISKELVTYGEFSSLFPNQKKPIANRRRSQKPVTGVDFAYAQAFARTKGGRLPTPAELKSAQGLAEAGTPGFAQDKSLWEWLDDGTEGTQALRAVGNAKGETRTQRPRGHNSVGFRVVIDL